MATQSSTRIAVFCKAPVAGRVKTRLIPAFGADGAVAIYRELAERTLATVATTCRRLGAEATLWVADDAQHAAIRDWSERFAMPVHAQQGADLGQRMQHCLANLAANGDAAMLIGTDCPALTADDLCAASWALSADCHWVFTPAEDGGYVLVGSNAPNATPFTGIAWSTAAVMAQTRAALAAAGQRWAEMPMRWDVDEPADAERAIAARLISR